MSIYFKWWIVVGIILNIIGIFILWRPEMAIIPQLMLIVLGNCIYFLVGLMAELFEQINRI